MATRVGMSRTTIQAPCENFVPAMQSPGYFDAMTNLVGYDIRDRLEEIKRLRQTKSKRTKTESEA